MNNKISLIYCTCDNYESLWEGFFTLWHKYWPTFDAQVILNTETKSFAYNGYRIRRPIIDKSSPTWSERLYASLNMVGTPYVLLVLDDFYLKSAVDTNSLNMCIMQMDKNDSIDLFTFCWQPGRNKKCDFSDKFEKRGRFAPYRVNAQIALWRVSYLKKIIKKYENPWQFELNGSFRSSIYGGQLFSLKKDAPLIFDYDWGFLIVRGKINREVSKYFEQEEGISFDESFKDIDMKAYLASGKNNKKKIWRYSKHLWGMIISFFKA